MAKIHHDKVIGFRLWLQYYDTSQFVMANLCCVTFTLKDANSANNGH